MKLDRASYKIMNESISLYLSFDDENIIVRFIGSKKPNISNLEEYLMNPTNKEYNYYKTLILVKREYNSYLNEDEQQEKLLTEADIKFNKLLDEFLKKISIIEEDRFVKEDYWTEDETDKLIVQYNGVVFSKKIDLISHLANILLEEKIEINQEKSSDENQLSNQL